MATSSLFRYTFLNPKSLDLDLEPLSLLVKENQVLAGENGATGGKIDPEMVAGEARGLYRHKKVEEVALARATETSQRVEVAGEEDMRVAAVGVGPGVHLLGKEMRGKGVPCATVGRAGRGDDLRETPAIHRHGRQCSLHA